MLHEVDWEALSHEWNVQTPPYLIKFTSQSPDASGGRNSFDSRLSPLLPVREPDTRHSRWTEDSIEAVLKSTTNPIGKFLRDMNMSAKDALRLDIMPFLDMAPRKPRGKYGKRQDISPEEKLLISRERNREHARATRLRRKVFEVVLEDQLSKLQNSLEVTLRRTRVASDANLMQYVADVFKALDSDAYGECLSVGGNFQLHFQLTHTAAAKPVMAVQSALFCGRGAAGECMRGLLEYLSNEAKSHCHDPSSLPSPRLALTPSDTSSPLQLQTPHCLTPTSSFNTWSPLQDMSPFPFTLSPPLAEEESCTDELHLNTTTRDESDTYAPLSPLLCVLPTPAPKRIRLVLTDISAAIVEGTSVVVQYTISSVLADGSLHNHCSQIFLAAFQFSGIESTNSVNSPIIVDAHIDIDVNDLLK